MKFKNLKANIIEDVKNPELVAMMEARPETYEKVAETKAAEAPKKAKEVNK